MPPSSSYRPLRPAIKAPSPPPPPPRDDSEPPLNPKRKRGMIAVACDNCRSRKIACDGKRPLCGQCARRCLAGPRVCDYRDKHETHVALRRRIEALQAEVAAHENTLSQLISLPDDEALRLLHYFRSTRPSAPPREVPLQPNDDEPPPPPFFPPFSPLPDDADAPSGDYRDEEDETGDDETENHYAWPVPPVDDDATLPLLTTNPPCDSLGPQGPAYTFFYPPPMAGSGEDLYPYEDGPSALERLPTMPAAESDMQWQDLYLK